MFLGLGVSILRGQGCGGGAQEKNREVGCNAYAPRVRSGSASCRKIKQKMVAKAPSGWSPQSICGLGTLSSLLWEDNIQAKTQRWQRSGPIEHSLSPNHRWYRQHQEKQAWAQTGPREGVGADGYVLAGWVQKHKALWYLVLGVAEKGHGHHRWQQLPTSPLLPESWWGDRGSCVNSSLAQFLWAFLKARVRLWAKKWLTKQFFPGLVIYALLLLDSRRDLETYTPLCRRLLFSQLELERSSSSLPAKARGPAGPHFTLLEVASPGSFGKQGA